MKLDVRKMVTMGVLAALSIILMMVIRFPIIPAAPFLEYEPADVPILIGTFMYGPAGGFILTVVVSIIQAMTVSAGSGWIGAVMHILATGAFVLLTGTIYRKMHTFKGAVISLIAGTLAMTVVMIPCNLFFTVRFLGAPIEVVKSMMLPAIIPFNLIKASVNSIIVLLIYKPISKFLKQHIQ